MKKLKIISLLIGLFLITGCGEVKYMTEGKLDKISFKETNEITNYVKIEMMDDSLMLVELNPETAPLTVENFQKLVSEKFYDNLTFHRIVKDFMIQGGDPTGTGNGGSPDKITGEFSKNGVDNTLSHTRGVISMARSLDMNSASSQFFIYHADVPSLDGSYAAFGKLISGYDTLDKLANVSVNGETPVNKPQIKTIRFVTIEEK